MYVLSIWSVDDPAGSRAGHAQAGEGEGNRAGGADQTDVRTGRAARDGAAPADGAAAPALEVGDCLEQQHAQHGAFFGRAFCVYTNVRV